MRAFKYTGGQITVPGAYVGVPISDYHNDVCASRFVTASSLKRAKRSMAHFWSYCPWNPDHEPPDVDTDALRLGKVAHVEALEPERVKDVIAVSPYADYRTKEAGEWKAAQLAAGLVPVKQAEYAVIQRMAAQLRAHPEALALFRNGLPEITFAARDEPTGIWRLTRPDFTPAAAGRGLCDYKTCADASYGAFGRQAFDLGYDLQVALALDVVAEVTGEMRPTMWFVAQEKAPPFAVSVHHWDADQIQHGRRQVRTLLDNIARCVESGVWPGYGEARSIETPFWVQKEIDAARMEQAA